MTQNQTLALSHGSKQIQPMWHSSWKPKSKMDSESKASMISDESLVLRSKWFCESPPLVIAG